MGKPSLGFISVRVVGAQQDLLRDIAIDAGVKPLGEDKYHCTVCYDVNNEDKKEFIPTLPFKEFEGTIIGVEELGVRKDGIVKAIAFVMDSESLTKEHELFKHVGHTHTFNEFVPHVSIAYDLTEEEADHLKFVAERLIGTVLYFDREAIEIIK